MKIVSWNIRLGLQKGLDALVAELTVIGPDIVAIQEVGRYWWMGPAGDTTLKLARALGFDHHLFVPCIRMSGGREYGHALVSRFPLSRPKMVSLPQRVDEPRRLLQVVVDTPEGPLAVLSVHLSHVDDRAAQGLELAQRFADIQAPALVIGDLNETDAEWLRAMQTEGLDTGRNPTFPAQLPAQRIDYIIGKGVSLGPASVPDTGDTSDHRPVVADVTLIF